jgi:GNAT superfamily N-acetyltransferase
VPGYRFCRTDDVPLLVEAHNRCYAPHFVGEPPMTAADFRRDAKELGLWASSCMVALADGEPIGVLLAAKRDDATLVHRVGVHPEHLRRGHGRHLLESLAQKLAILGPPRLEAELPDALAAVAPFLEACGLRAQARYADFVRDAAPAGERPARGVLPVGLGDLLANGAFDSKLPRSWQRSVASLQGRARQLEGVAIASDERVEAFVLHRADGPGREIVALGHAAGETAEAFLGILVRHVGAVYPAPLAVPRIAQSEVRFELLESWGFRKTASVVGYAATA